jgi:hypothetical protein
MHPVSKYDLVSGEHSDLAVISVLWQDWFSCYIISNSDNKVPYPSARRVMLLRWVSQKTTVIIKIAGRVNRCRIRGDSCLSSEMILDIQS